MIPQRVIPERQPMVRVFTWDEIFRSLEKTHSGEGLLPERGSFSVLDENGQTIDKNAAVIVSWWADKKPSSKTALPNKVSLREAVTAELPKLSRIEDLCAACPEIRDMVVDVERALLDALGRPTS